MAWILPEDELANPHVRGAAVQPAKRLYSLFVHYSLKPSEVVQEGLPNRIALTAQAAGRLERDLEFLKKLLAPKQGWHGFAFLFLDPGWKELLALTDRYGIAVVVQAVTRLQQDMDGLVLGRVPIRFVTAARLVQFLGILEQNARGSEARFSDYLVGREDRFQYDSVKVIEAVIRIANFGRNIPILRFDSDVVFPEGGRDPDKVRDNVLLLCRRYTELADHPDVHYFVFSGSYLPPERVEAIQTNGEFDPSEALNGFATRVGQLARIPENADLAQAARLDLEAIRAFLGSLWKVGANPFRQVISGAGLCLSDSAILDLPPYSNMREFVMWIDDHLKFGLHHELRHFGYPGPDPAATPEHGPLPRIGRVEAWFPQNRHPISEGGFTLKDVRWHTSEYFLRLLRGCIADKWLRESPELKRPENYYERKVWLRFLKRGEYARYFVRALTSRIEAKARAEIRGRLWKSARERLREIVKVWEDPSLAGTFLHMIVVGPTEADGRSESRYAPSFAGWLDRGFVPGFCPRGLRQAVTGLGEDPPPPPARRRRPARRTGVTKAPTLGGLIADLIDDFIDYIELVRFWKTFVQSTRFLLNTERDRREVFWAFPAEYPPGV